MRIRIAVAIVAILAPATATAAASLSHRERFTISGKTAHEKQGPIKVVATGPIHGTGAARFIEHGKTSDGTFYLPGGRLFITFLGTRFVSHLHPRACTATFDYDGTFTIKGGTRRYRNATGQGTFAEHRKYIGQRDQTGRCLPKAPPAVITAINHAKGSVSL